MDFDKFYRGFEYKAYEFLGAHLQGDGTVFRVYAPAASSVKLLIKGESMDMGRIWNGQFWEIYVPGVYAGERYMFGINGSDGIYTERCDPYGFQMEVRPAHKSIVCNTGLYEFKDQDWMNSRKNSGPMNIYEMHLGSWKGGWQGYRNIAGELVAYLKETGYNYVEFLPLAEHPLDESWGYQTTGYFSPTSRYGSPEDLMYLIDTLHQNGIGAILDFVPVHFAVDGYGLKKFDGSFLFEYPSSDVGFSEWGSCNFMHSRPEVRCFLGSAADYWLSKFHFDGLRMDAISRMIYWQGDEKRGVNGNAVDFLKNLNAYLKETYPGIVLVAEDSTDYRGTTSSLGFDYKWDMGWMHDTLDFFSMPFDKRTEARGKIPFSMVYFRNEKYLLALSHDENVHGKGTIIGKIFGSDSEKMAQGRVLYLYMMIHPGAKLNFMGSELAQKNEWNEKKDLNWSLLDNPENKAFWDFIRDLNALYLANPALWQKDYSEDGFSWIDTSSINPLVYGYKRTNGIDSYSVYINLGKEAVRIQPDSPEFQVVLSSGWKKYGGNEEEKSGNDDCLVLQPLSGFILKD